MLLTTDKEAQRLHGRSGWIEVRGQPNGHTVAFRSRHLKADETVLGYLEGWIDRVTDRGATEAQVGQLILTNRRLCLYRKTMFGDHLSEVDLLRITATDEVERSGFRYLRA